MPHTLLPTISFNGITETLNLGYEPDFGDDTEDDFTSGSDSEADVGEDTDVEDFNGLVLALNEKEDGVNREFRKQFGR